MKVKESWPNYDQDQFQPVSKQVETIILDISPDGYELFERIDDLLSVLDNYETDLKPSVGVIFQVVVGDIIRLLDFEHQDAISELQMFPRTEPFHDIVLLMEPERFSKLVGICQVFAIQLYLKLSQEILYRRSRKEAEGIAPIHSDSTRPPHRYSYLPMTVNRDCVIIREFITEFVPK